MGWNLYFISSWPVMIFTSVILIFSYFATTPQPNLRHMIYLAALWLLSLILYFFLWIRVYRIFVRKAEEFVESINPKYEEKGVKWKFSYDPHGFRTYLQCNLMEGSV
jgi:uncharacterized membrane protein YobD (UPF0266 family)